MCVCIYIRMYICIYIRRRAALPLPAALARGLESFGQPETVRSVYIYVYIGIYIHVYIYVCIYIYIYGGVLRSLCMLLSHAVWNHLGTRNSEIYIYIYVCVYI